MKPRPLYTAEHKCHVRGWTPILEATMCISKMYCIGFINGMGQYYPCPELRVVDGEGKIVAEHHGHGSITVGKQENDK